MPSVSPHAAPDAAVGAHQAAEPGSRANALSGDGARASTLIPSTPAATSLLTLHLRQRFIFLPTPPDYLARKSLHRRPRATPGFRLGCPPGRVQSLPARPPGFTVTRPAKVISSSVVCRMTVVHRSSCHSIVGNHQVALPTTPLPDFCTRSSRLTTTSVPM